MIKILPKIRVLMFLILGCFIVLHCHPRGWDFLYAADAKSMRVTGIVTNASQLAPLKKGETCQIHLVPDFKAMFNCRIYAECKRGLLFSKEVPGIMADCETQDGLFLSARHNIENVDLLYINIAAGILRMTDGYGEPMIDMKLY